MFISFIFRDSVTISSIKPFNTSDVKQSLLRKYSSRIINQSICISIHTIHKIHSIKYIEGYRIADASFELLAFKFFENEIITGIVTSQDADCIKVSMPLFNNIKVPRSLFPEPMIKKIVNRESVWCWQFNDEEYCFRNGAQIRVRVKNVEDGMNVTASINEQGLGLAEWWE